MPWDAVEADICPGDCDPRLARRFGGSATQSWQPR
jgi:hypothetical protein